jgi:hypothetical protein
MAIFVHFSVELGEREWAAAEHIQRQSGGNYKKKTI